MIKPKIVVIVGATASGKTNLAIEIAKKFNGEIISADSRQVYKDLDIGTAKVTKEEKRDIPHYLIDIREVNETYSASDFVNDAKNSISEISDRKKLPIITGGTFFYIDALLNKYPLPPVPPNPDLRRELESLSTEELVDRLKQSDPDRADTIDTQNRRRLIRSLEIGQTLKQVPKSVPKDSTYETLWLGIKRDKEDLRNRYLARAKIWLDGRFQAEVESLIEAGITKTRLQEIGFEYQLMLDYLSGNLTKDEFIQKTIEKNWQYAKRQLTWLKRNPEIHWFKPDDFDKSYTLVEEFLDN
ncbi:tRNA (adenosine(37)-N6)-dimethylallyltransferase MiaA [Candidatus Kaiserbacteria bacterium]|nr:tRNA (adenosine(37)-N6)-dimethylallyltransferase MiaA [Candidatus Kaiserbacteria bacterium]